MKMYAKIQDLVTKLAISWYRIEVPNMVWTRGDGVRYKDPNKLKTQDTNSVWKRIISEFPISKTLQVSGEFGSSPYDDAVIWDGIVLINRKTYIQFASRSILRNRDIWRSR